MENTNNITVKDGNKIFLIGASVLFVFNMIIQTKQISFNVNSYKSLIIEVCFFLAPSLVYLLITKKNIKMVLRLNPISIKNVLLIIVIMIFSLPVIGIINYVVTHLISGLGKPLPYEIPIISGNQQMFMAIIFIALSPAICEEIMCRGVIMRAYEGFGHKKMIIISALLFAILHRNVQTFAAIFFMGLLLGYFTYKTNSIFAGIIAHFTNNFIASFLSFSINKYYKSEGMDNLTDNMEQNIKILENMDIIVTVSILTFVSIFVLIFWGLLTVFRRNNTFDFNIDYNKPKERGIYSYIPLIAGIILISVEYVNQIIYIFTP